MYTRIMAVVLTVILLLTTVLSGIGLVALRNQQITAIKEELREEAREIAYLAAQSRSTSYGFFGTSSSDMQKYIQWKANAVYDEYGAYILVVDRSGRMMDNMNAAYADNPDFAQTLNGRDIMEALARVLSGQEIDVQLDGSGNTYFTIGVPFVQSSMVLGAVFIQTPAQVIEGGAGALISPVVGIAVLAIILSGAVLLVYLRRMLRPLNSLTVAARAMAEGDFAVRVDTPNATPEVAELSVAFNSMADQLSAVENSRREFVANVSHELRSPITAISGYVEGMVDGVIPVEDYGRYLSIVSDETKRLSKLIGELLALSRLERDDAALDMTDFDICDMLERVFLRRTGDLESRHMDVDCDFQPEPCYVHADAARIEQVAVNLVDNAIKFTPDGGEIRLMVRVQDGVCVVTVKDNGVGILPEDRPRVFERFFTADRAHTSGKGTGLGLSICQRIMEMHGQRIWLAEADDGAAFSFTLALKE
ncbi:MAG: HAMP domain-containing histidine kinase [Clostridia bacterium]|nr:HAMP domain-containing histidine kinase [Clostridia bacterium]